MILLSIFGIQILRKYRVRRKLIAAREQSSHQNDALPYFQQKAELHGDQCRYEMEDDHRRQEAEAVEMPHEMPGDEVPEHYLRHTAEAERTRPQELVAREKQELTEDGIFQELEAYFSTNIILPSRMPGKRAWDNSLAHELMKLVGSTEIDTECSKNALKTGYMLLEALHIYKHLMSGLRRA